jgi:hypothetical protein
MEDIFDTTEGDIVLANGLLNLDVWAKLHTLNYNKATGDIDGRKRLRYEKEIKYIYYNYSFKSPYATYSTDEREVSSKIAAGLDVKFKISAELQEAINWYVSHLDKSPYFKALKQARSLAHRTIDSIEKLDINAKDTNGKPIYKLSEVMEAIENVDKMLTSLSKLEENVKKNVGGGSKIWGGHKLGGRENPNDYKKTKLTAETAISKITPTNDERT